MATTPTTEPKQLYDDGDVIVDHNNNEFEVTAVSKVLNADGSAQHYTYHVRLKSEVDADRTLVAEIETAKQKALEAAGEQAKADAEATDTLMSTTKVNNMPAGTTKNTGGAPANG